MRNSLEIAAQCWCDPRVSNREMDVELAQVFADAIESARKEAVESAYSRGLGDAYPEVMEKRSILLTKGYELGYRAGFLYCQEKAAEIIHASRYSGHDGEYRDAVKNMSTMVEDEIRALQPDQENKK